MRGEGGEIYMENEREREVESERRGMWRVRGDREGREIYMEKEREREVEMEREVEI